MRVVLDTNVLVSGLLSPQGTCARLLDLVADGALSPCVDDRIMAEYESVLRRPRLRIDAQDAQVVLTLFVHAGVSVTAPPLSVRLPDPGDLPFLEVAVAADAPLVTGNMRHYPTRAGVSATVMSPAEFIERFSRR